MEEQDIYNTEQDSNLRYLQSQNQNLQSQALQQQMYMQEQERSMVKDQLDLSEEIEKINYLLKGFTFNANTGDWDAPKDESMIVLTDYGVHLITNTIQWYINKNTLLSNYQDDIILNKMEDFATALADVVFMEYEKVFKYPSLDDCIKVLRQRIQTKVDTTKFTLKLKGIVKTEDQITSEIIFEMQDRIEDELTKIKEQIIKNKLKRFELLIRVVQDAVHSTYLRAFNGQERRTLREHINITETKGLTPQGNNQGGTGWNPLNWFSGTRTR